MYTIYILKCEENKYYIGKTKKLAIRLEDHFNENGAEWTKIYKPVEVMELHSNCNSFDEDKFTLQYMEKYGIDNVRGGTFTRFRLDQNDIIAINRMIRGATDKCHNCGSNEHFVSNCPGNKTTHIVDNFVDTISTSKQIELTSKQVNNSSFTSTISNVLSDIWATISSLAMPITTTTTTSLVEENDLCYRCARKGHYAKECYSKTDVNGYILNDICYKCNKKGHYAKDCYLNSNNNCGRCGRIGHHFSECGYITFANGQSMI